MWINSYWKQVAILYQFTSFSIGSIVPKFTMSTANLTRYFDSPPKVATHQSCSLPLSGLVLTVTPAFPRVFPPDLHPRSRPFFHVNRSTIDPADYVTRKEK